MAMRKTLKKIDSLCLTTLGALLVSFALSSCASKHSSAFSEKEVSQNIYLQELLSKEDSKLLKKASESSFSLMRATFDSYLKELKNYETLNAWLATLPSGIIHGDSHIKQVSWRNLVPSLDDWDTVSEGPYWSDILRAELSAKLMAKSLGFRNEDTYPCLDAYTKAIVRNEYPEIPRSFDNHIKANSDKDLSTSKDWTGAQNLLASQKPLYEGFLKFAKDNAFAIDRETPVKSYSSGIGSLTKDKLLFLDAQNSLWELKEVDAQPLGTFRPLSTTNPNDLCSRYNFLIKHDGYEDSKPRACFSFDGKVFTLLKWSHSFYALKSDHVQSFAQLEKYTKWVCSELAKFHMLSMNDSTRDSQGGAKKRKWSMILKSPAPFQTTIQRMTSEIAKTHEDAYRMLLLHLEK